MRGACSFLHRDRAMLIDFNRTEASAEPVSIAINAVLEAGARAEEETTRGYLGASAVGHPCSRKVQYDWVCDPVHPTRTRDIFARGHFLEEQSRQHFKKAGFRLADKDRLEFTALDGWLRGHADGILLSGPNLPDVAYPCFKGINQKSWRSLERDGLGQDVSAVCRPGRALPAASRCRSPPCSLHRHLCGRLQAPTHPRSL